MAAGTRVGTGFVDLEPELARDFHETIARKLNEKLTPALKKVGKRTGKEFGREVAAEADRDLGRSLAPVVKRFEKLGRDASAAVRKGWGAGGKQNAIAIGGMDAMSDFFARTKRDAQKALPAIERVRARLREMRRDFKRTDFKGLGSEIRQLASTHLKGLGGELRRVGSEFRKTDKRARVTSSGFGGFDGAMARVNRGAQFFRNILRTIKWPVLIAGLGLSLQGLSALAAGAVAAASALDSLSGVAIALPAALLAGAQAMGAFKLATAGVGDAVKAALDAEVQGGGQAVDMMRQQRDAAERVADAKRNLADQQDQARKAQDDLTDARESATRQLQDMRRASEETGLTEKEAALSLREARRELAQTLRDPESSGLDIQGAEHAVERARNELESTRVEAKRVRKDYAEAERGGIKQMPEVVAAEEAKADAKRAVTDANRDLQRATEDATEAMKEQGSAASAFHDKMSQLPPAGQKFVRFLVGLKPKLDALRATSAQGFFPGAEVGLKGAMRNFGVFRGIIGGTSKALGGLAAKAGRKLGSDVWGKDLGRLGKLNTRIIGRLGDSFFNLADALRHTLVSAEPFLDWFSGSIEEFTGWIATEAEAGRETGRLGEFFDRTRESMELVGPILKGVGGALLNIGEAARPLGNEILKALGGSAEGWRKWSDSITGQNSLAKYFKEAKPAIFEMGKLIGAVGKAFFQLGAQDGVAHLLRLVRTELIPAMTDVTGAVTGWASDFLTQFGALRKDGVPTFEAFLVTLADKAGEAGGKIAKLLWHAFWGASVWGKAAMGALLLSKFDGLRGVLGKLGLRAGGALGKAMISRLAPTIAAEMAAGSKLGEILSTRMYKLGKIGGRRFAIGAAAGIALLAPWLGTKIGKSIPEGTRTAIRRWGINAGENFVNALIWAINKGIRAINDTLDATNVLGKLGVDAPEIGEIDEVNFHSELERQGEEAREAMEKGFINGPGGTLIKPDEIPAPKTDKAKTGYERFRKQVGKEGELTRTAWRNQLAPLPGIAGQSAQGMIKQTLPRLDTLKTQGGKKGDAFASRVGGSFGSLAGAAKEAFENIETNIRGALKGLGSKALPNFNLKLVPKLMNMLPPLKPQGHQQGGFIVPGTGSGDTFRTALPVGSGILNREATATFGFQKGGLMPVALEPGEAVFMPQEVKAMGPRTFSAMNAAVPRFQKGGRLGPEPEIKGPMGALRSLGQSAIGKVYEGAQDHLSNQKQRGMFGGSLGTSKGQLGAVERLAAKFGLTMTSGFRPWDTDSFHGQDRARDFSNGVNTPEMRAFAIAVAQRWGRRLLEMFYDPLGWYIDNGQKIPGAIGGHSDHVHVAMQRGGLLGLVQKFAGGGFVGNINRVYAEHNSADGDWGGETLPSYLVAALAEAAGQTLGISVPGVTMEQITRGESGAHKANSARPGATGIDPGGTKGLGLWMITTGFNDALISKYGGQTAMRNPVKNAAAMASIYQSNGLGAWYGDGSVTGSNLHYEGNYDIRNALGGATFRQALKGEAPSAATGGEATAATKEKVPPTYKGAKAGERVTFGPMPKDLPGVDREIAKLQPLVGKYRVAKKDAEKKGKTGTAQAIGRNLTAIEDRLKGLRQRRSRLRLQKAKKALTKRLGKALGRFGDYEQFIDGAQLDYDKASQDALQIVDLEPQSPELPANATDAQRAAAEKDYVARFTQYVDGPERSAYGRVLETAANWRNTILKAQRFGFGKGEPSVIHSQGRWEGETRGARSRMDQIHAYTEAVRKRVQKFRAENKPGTPLPAGLADQVAARNRMHSQEMPLLRLKDKQLSGAITTAREMFFPGGKNRLKPPALPIPGTGSLEDKLREVQGIHQFPELHELLPASALAPPRVAGRFGGAIWDVQGSIEELGLKISRATNSLAGPSQEDGKGEHEDLLRELLTQANQEKLVRRIEEKVLGGRESLTGFQRGGSLPFAGVFHGGGVTPGPAHQESIALVRGQETILPFTPDDMADLGGVRAAAPPSVTVYVYEGDDVRVEVEDQKVEAVVKRMGSRDARNAARPRASKGAGVFGNG